MEKHDYNKKSLALHARLKGKLEVTANTPIESKDDLSVVYSPGVAAPCMAIADDPSTVYDLTIKGRTVAVVSDGSAVLGLGNIGAYASIPVMEGKAALFKKFAGLNAFPICLDTQDTEEIIRTVKLISPVFGGVNLEDISAPRSFEIEQRLQDIGIPVFHDDQHGTAIVTLAGLINACKVVGKNLNQLNIVINGAGAAGIAITNLLKCHDHGHDRSSCISVKSVIVCDSKGIISKDRDNLNEAKKKILTYTNPHNKTGSLVDAMQSADVFIGVSKGNLLEAAHIQAMADKPIIFAIANPTPEIMPEKAKALGAAIVATGRSDYPNQVNNVLAFPGIFKGALQVRAPRITADMKIAAAEAIAACEPSPTTERIIPNALNMEIANKVAQAIMNNYHG